MLNATANAMRWTAAHVFGSPRLRTVACNA